MQFVDLDTDSETLLRALAKDERLVPYGGANFGMPLALIEPTTDRLVPNDRFFVRSNGPVPVIDPRTWRLRISGHVEQDMSLSLDELLDFALRRCEAFLECAGNGRTRFDPLPPGTPWRNDAIGNALWEGVSLADLLAAVGILPGAVDLVTRGGDFAEMRRGLPLAVALDLSLIHI